MSDLLFDTPWWLPVLILAAGIAIFITGNRRLENRLRNAGLAVVLLGIALAAVSYFVDTPLETAEKRTVELCRSFEQTDWAKMTSILDRSTAVTVLSATIYSGRDEIVSAAKHAHEKYGFKTVRILSKDAARHDTVI